jgi:hypothetical protein
MYKLNDTSDKYEVGSSAEASQLTYASLSKYTTNSHIKLKRLKSKIISYIVFYERMECLIAIKFSLFNYSNNTEIFTDPKVFGPVESCIY